MFETDCKYTCTFITLVIAATTISEVYLRRFIICTKTHVCTFLPVHINKSSNKTEQNN